MNDSKMTIRAVKTKARILLRGKYERFALMVLLYGVIYFICVLIPSMAFPDISVLPFFIMMMILSYMLMLIASMFSIGLSKSALSISRESGFAFSDILYSFKNQSNSFLLLEMLIIGINIVLQLPAYILDIVSGTGYIEYFFMVLAASFVSMLITIRIRFAIYILMDNPGVTLTQAVKMSLSVTKGNYLRILMLTLSFIPMFLLGAASFAIGFLVVIPYIETSNAIMYTEISAKGSDQTYTW